MGFQVTFQGILPGDASSRTILGIDAILNRAGKFGLLMYSGNMSFQVLHEVGTVFTVRDRARVMSQMTPDMLTAGCVRWAYAADQNMRHLVLGNTYLYLCR